MVKCLDPDAAAVAFRVAPPGAVLLNLIDPVNKIGEISPEKNNGDMGRKYELCKF